MKHLDDAKKSLTSFAVVVGASITAFENSILDKFSFIKSTPASSKPFIIGISSFFLVTFALLIAIRILMYLIDNVNYVRKFFLNNHYIEGVFVNVVYDEHKIKIVGGGLIYISIEKNKIILQGETFNKNSQPSGHFYNEISDYDDDSSTLRFTYTTSLDDETIYSMDGYGEYKFYAFYRYIPQFFWGHFYVHGQKKRYEVYGERVKKPDELRLLDGEIQVRGQFVSKFLERISSTLSNSSQSVVEK